MSELEEDTGAETSTDIGSQLAAAFDGATSTEPSSTTAPASARETVSGEQNASTAQAVVLEAPKHWSDADKALFGTAPPDIRKRWIDREAESARSYDAKYQELASFRREREALDELFKPFSRDLQLAGIDRTAMVRSFLGVHQLLQEDPRQAIQWILQNYQIDPSVLNAQEEQTDPRFAKLEQRFQQFEGKLTGFMSAQQQQEHQGNLSRVQTFAEAKGDDGKLLHPYFDEVATDIVQLMKAGEKDLEKAYTKAVRLNDSIFEKMQTEKTLGTSKDRDRERLAEISKAKRAAVGNEGPQPKGPAKPRSLDEDLRSGFAEWSGS